MSKQRVYPAAIGLLLGNLPEINRLPTSQPLTPTLGPSRHRRQHNHRPVSCQREQPPSSASPSPPLYHYNLVNPYPGSWSALVPTVVQYFQRRAKNTPIPIESVPFVDWLAALQASAALGSEDVPKNPGIKLLGFYEEMSELSGRDGYVLETSETGRTSDSMRCLTPVGKEWMGIWLEQWAF
ncbi:hypothetical protein IMSHALPRED_001981 [Imshaugia aleurites]|uniref:Uncharacterized protein n=1 Tax=Imshaugia aleurites TaxID=172621 RepID=A0A8H3IBJ7_9LECA|nr:hypothetical protein IMSHALPRED_001981 [Imshaugia aleurites]